MELAESSGYQAVGFSYDLPGHGGGSGASMSKVNGMYLGIY